MSLLGIITTALCCFSHCLSIWVLFTVLIPINRKITPVDPFAERVTAITGNSRR